MLGKVEKLYIAPLNTSGIREKKETIFLKKDFGIKEDKFAGGERDRSIMLIGKNSYEIAKNRGISLPEVALGENILLDFDPHVLESGAILEIGEVLLEITKECTLCKHLTKYSSKLPKLLLGRRGIYCRILKNGTIKIGDSVKVLKQEVAI